MQVIFDNKDLVKALGLFLGDEVILDGKTYEVSPNPAASSQNVDFILKARGKFPSISMVDLVGKEFTIVNSGLLRPNKPLTLKETKHGYACAHDEGGCTEYDNWAEFMKDDFDIELNLPFRFDIDKEDDIFYLVIHCALQRHGTNLWHIRVNNLKQEDMTEVEEILRGYKINLAQIWKEVRIRKSYMLEPGELTSYKVGDKLIYDGTNATVISTKLFHHGYRYEIRDEDGDTFWVKEGDIGFPSLDR